MSGIDLACNVAGVQMKNPILAASGTFGYGLLYEKFYDVSLLGGFVSKGLSLKPTAGGPVPRICETPSGMLNAIGLQNVGLDNFVNKKLPKLTQRDTAIIVNFFGETIGEYAELAGRLGDVDGIDGLEMNISCPNIDKGGAAFGTDVNITAEVVRACRDACKKPLIVKLSPNVTDIAEFARVCEDNGADGLSLINTLLGMAIDINTGKPMLARSMGGLSGPAIKPVALRMVWQCYKAVKIPIFGMGGIACVDDVVEFMMAGASAVQVGTMNFVDPTIGATLVEQLPVKLSALGFANLSDVIGVAHEK